MKFTSAAAAFVALTASTSQAFAPSSNNNAAGVVRSGGPLQMYLDSLSNAPPLSFSDSAASSNPPSTFGELLTTENDMNDICAFNAASLDIQSTISSNGGITAAQIQESIRRANEVVSIIRQHFPGAMGSSEILERVKRVLDMYNAENILLTQSGKFLLLFFAFTNNDVSSLIENMISHTSLHYICLSKQTNRENSMS